MAPITPDIVPTSGYLCPIQPPGVIWPYYVNDPELCDAYLAVDRHFCSLDPVFQHRLGLTCSWSWVRPAIFLVFASSIACLVFLGLVSLFSLLPQHQSWMKSQNIVADDDNKESDPEHRGRSLHRSTQELTVVDEKHACGTLKEVFL